MFDPASWIFSEVFAGVEPFHENVDQIGVMPPEGFASLGLEMSDPAGVKPGFTKILKPISRPPDVTSAAHVPPLLAEVTRLPLTYGLEFGDVQLQTYA